MIKLCKTCKCILTEDNTAKKNRKYYRNVCKKCRSKKQIEYQKNMDASKKEKRKAYIRAYLRKTGKVIKFPCEYCKKLCYKKYKRAFCSDKCRFLSHVIVSNDCWMWAGGKNKSGYGKFSFNKVNSFPSHRASFILFNGEIPNGMCVCHSCDNPSCVNPDHLWLGTTQENANDMVNKFRSLRGIKHFKSKLCDKDILRIRELNNIKGWTQKEIGEIFSITTGHVNNIIKRRVWSHVELDN